MNAADLAATLLKRGPCSQCGRVMRLSNLWRHVPTHSPEAAAARFWSRVDRLDGDFACWPWKGRLQPSGYARFHLPGVGHGMAAHRFAYELLVGPIPDGLQLDHLCRVRHCVNPAHLEPVTGFENVHRSPITAATVNARKTHCPQGHPYNEANTLRYRGERICVTCRRRHQREAARRRYYARKAAVA